LKGEEALRRLVEPQRPKLLTANVTDISKELSSILPEVDKKVLLENKDIGDNIIAALQEGLKNSCDGWVDDDLAFVDSWGSSLDEIKTPVFLYQGSEDLMVPFGHGQWLAQKIPQKYLTAHLLQKEGHYSIWQNQMHLIFEELTSLR
jgi:pimeloyl-ACP methyl ester carboxylesterase